MTERPWWPGEDGLYLRVRVQAGAKSAGVDGVTATGGRPALKVRVRAPARNGRANAAVAEVLGTSLGLKPRAIRVAHGARGRDKTLHAAGDADTLAAHLDDALS